MLDFKNYPEIPELTRGALLRYVNDGLRPGGFLTCVLSNDLMGAISRADVFNQKALLKICQFIYNEMPSNSHGSREKVENWMDKVLLAKLAE